MLSDPLSMRRLSIIWPYGSTWSNFRSSNFPLLRLNIIYLTLLCCGVLVFELFAKTYFADDWADLMYSPILWFKALYMCIQLLQFVLVCGSIAKVWVTKWRNPFKWFATLPLLVLTIMCAAKKLSNASRDERTSYGVIS